MQLVPADICRGHRWAVAPSRSTIYYRATLAPLEQAAAITEAVAALSRHHGPALRLVPPPGEAAS